jgi:FkbM family methyltransferase
MKKFFWNISNIFGYLFGRRFFAPVHHVIINLSLHGLGYDNMWFDSLTGEEWFIKRVLSPSNPKVCLDIGANIGKYTNLLLRHTNANIYAIEPSTSSFEKLKNLESRVVKVKAAIADFDGEAVLYSKGNFDPRASLDKNVRGGDEEKVSVLTIQNLAKKYSIAEIDFIKIDTEGYEREALKGLGDLRPEFIQFEFNVHHLYRNCTLYELTQLLPDYKFYRLLTSGWLEINPKKYLNNIFMFCNVVAVRKR